MIIYKTINLINGKIYVGQTMRNDEKYLGSGTILMRAIEKYGKDNFIRVTLCECESKKELNTMEKYWIKITNSRNPVIGYNISKGGQYNSIGKYDCSGINNSFYGKTHSEESKEKMRQAKLGKKLGPYSETHRKKIGDAQRGKKRLGGWTHSEETKLKLRDSHIKLLKNPEYMIKVSNGLRKYYFENPTITREQIVTSLSNTTTFKGAYKYLNDNGCICSYNTFNKYRKMYI